MKIEQFSSLDVKGPCNILATNIQGSIAWLLWLRLQRVRNSQSLQWFLSRKKMKCISWIKNTLVFMMVKFGSVLSVISTYLKLHIWIKINWRQIGRIHWSHAVGGANGSAMVVMFMDCCVGGGRYFPYYSYCRNPTGKEFFVPAGTL